MPGLNRVKIIVNIWEFVEAEPVVINIGNEEKNKEKANLRKLDFMF